MFRRLFATSPLDPATREREEIGRARTLRPGEIMAPQVPPPEPDAAEITRMGYQVRDHDPRKPQR
ncbi:MAG: hypothetical protein SFX73_34890 [Kofleriaceae bacterium]|nr:hypothetical protein [Kofleriaceae bacterium]